MLAVQSVRQLKSQISTICRGVRPTRSRPYSAPKTRDVRFMTSQPPEQGPAPATGTCRESRRMRAASSANFPQIGIRLLKLNLGAGFFELRLDLCRIVLVNALFHRFGSALDQVLGLLKSQAGNGTDFFNDFNLLLAGGREHDREFGLFLSRCRGTPAACWGGNRHGSGGRNTPFLFEQFGELRRL